MSEAEKIIMLRKMGILPSRYGDCCSAMMRSDVPADIERLMSMHGEVVGKTPATRR